MDEADEFYKDPSAWLKVYMKDLHGSAKRSATHVTHGDPGNPSTGSVQSHQSKSDMKLSGSKRRVWPQYLVFFEQLEPVLKSGFNDGQYRECRRFFNTHFHDDGRRKGDVVVWCMN